MKSVQVLVKIVREQILSINSTFCGGANYSAEKCFKRIRKEKEKARAAGDSEKLPTKHTTCKFFRYGYEY